MFGSLKTVDLNAGSIRSVSSQRSALFAEQDVYTSQQTAGFQARSSNRNINIGTFNRVFSGNGRINRNRTDTYRFTVEDRTRIRIYLGNQLGGAITNDRRMFVDLFNAGRGQRLRGLNIDAGRVNAVTAGLAPGNYRIRVSTRSKQTGNYFLDVVGDIRE